MRWEKSSGDCSRSSASAAWSSHTGFSAAVSCEFSTGAVLPRFLAAGRAGLSLARARK
jgi:hypothetical protein